MCTQEELSELLQIPGSCLELNTDDDSFKWNHNFTLMFLDLYATYRHSVGTLKMKSLKKMFEEIAKEMRLKTNRNISAANCENRWKHLERQYKKYVDHNNKTGRGRKDFEYSEKMDEILGKKRNINPIEVLSSNTKVNMPKEKNDVKDRNDASERVEILNDDKQDKNKENKDKVIAKGKPKIKKFKAEVLTEIRKDRQSFYKKHLELKQKSLEEKQKTNELLTKILEKIK